MTTTLSTITYTYSPLDITSKAPTSSSSTSSSPFLPEMTLLGRDEQGHEVKMKLDPERDIAPFECMLVTMLLINYCENKNQFCPLAFVKRQGLERHFHFSV